MRAYDFAYGAPEPLSAEEIAELENVLPATPEEAYAEGRKDEREECAKQLECLGHHELAHCLRNYR
jgi:hypothetical protein